MSSAMAGGGVYDHHSDYQLRGALSEATLVADVAGEIDPDEARGSVVIVDYGCAQGRVSNTLIGLAGERVRRSRPEAPIYVYHNDLLSNDWEGLLERLRGGDSYLQVAGGPITPLVSATSFYEPVAPPHLVDLGISFAAAQWLASRVLPGPALRSTSISSTATPVPRWQRKLIETGRGSSSSAPMSWPPGAGLSSI